LPQIPHFFLQSTTLTRGAADVVVADPFCGSGTVLLEAVLKGFRAVGADTNPLARLIARVKLTPISEKIILRSLGAINRALPRIPTPQPPAVVNIRTWYSSRIAAELAKLRVVIKKIRSPQVREFMQVCLSVCARKASFADPRLSVPVRINLARKTQYGPHYRQLRNHLTRIKRTSVLELFNDVVRKNASRVNSINLALDGAPGAVILEDGRSLDSKVAKDSVDLIITSPPYVGAQKYIRASSLSLGWLDMAYDGQLRPLERQTVGREHFSKAEIGSITAVGIRKADKLLSKVRKINPIRAHIAWTYLSEMERALLSMYRILRRGSNLVMITGPNTICGLHFDTPCFLEQLAHRVGFTTRFKLIDHIRSRGLMTKRNKTAGVIASEWVLCLRKK
jgi:DNA modification methylase